MIFSKKNRRTIKTVGTGAFVGAYLPQPFVETLTLLALTKDVSKTEVLCQLIQKVSSELADSISISSIAQKALWHYIDDQALPKKQRKYKNWHTFTVACRNELRTKKGLRSEVIMQIVDDLNRKNYKRTAFNKINASQ